MQCGYNRTGRLIGFSLSFQKVNVRLPTMPQPSGPTEIYQMLSYFTEGQFKANTFTAAVRISLAEGGVYFVSYERGLIGCDSPPPAVLA